MKRQEAERLAEKIATVLEAESQPMDLAALHARINKMGDRLDNLERAMLDTRAATVQLQHPSIDKFSVAEKIADEIFSGLSKEKACQFEPDKPCDHCSMCSSRGF